MKIETISTKRLYLRCFTKEDALFAISIWNSPKMGAYLPDAAMQEIDPEYLKEIQALGDDEDCCYLIATSKDGERIGTCSFIPSNDGKVYDIAYCVHKNYWRQGYATEMVSGMLDYAKNHGANKITVVVNKENVASNAVMRKFNFVVVGERSYKKRGTDITYSDYKYELDI